MGRGPALLLLGVMGTGAFLSGLELMITAVALPAIVVGLADWTELRPASWIINGYLLVSIVVMPLAGQLSDRHGVRRVFLWALLVFIAGSVLAGRSSSLTELIVARLVQAVGGGALVPVATAAASHLFAGAARPRALGAVGAMTFLGMAAGPFAGAWVLQAVYPAAALEALGITGGLRDALEDPWRYVFYLNVPVGLALLAAYLLVSAEVFLATAVRGEFRMSFLAFGPTELRIVLAFGALALFRFAEVRPFGLGPFLLFDIGGVVATAGLLAALVTSAARNTIALYRAEPIES